MGVSTTTRNDLLQQLVESLFLVIKQVHRDSEIREMPLSPPQARLLFAIARQGDAGTSVKELSETMGVTPGAITQFVNTLCDKGLVQREVVQDDRRMVKLTVTDSAKIQTREMRKLFLNFATRTFSVLNDDDLAQLAALLDKVKNGLDTGDTN